MESKKSKQESEREAAASTMRRINEVWLDGLVERLASLVHPDMVMAFPGFTGRAQGREEFLAGFSDFCRNASVVSFHDHDYLVDVVGDTAVVTFRYKMLYERSGERYHSVGRDLWVFQKEESAWIAVWRTMLEMEERPA